MMRLPLPDTHCFDDDTKTDCWSYSKELVLEIVRLAAAHERNRILKEFGLVDQLEVRKKRIEYDRQTDC